MIKIDVDTRCWKIPKEESFLGVESDDKVKILQFELSKNEFCNGLNFTDCNCFINYKNEGNDTIPYGITDMEVHEDGTVTFTWKVSRGATIFKGNTLAVLCAKKVSNDGTITNEWNSRIGSFIVAKGLEPSSSISEVPEIDIISQLLLVAQQTNANAQNNINQSSSLLEKAEGLGYLREEYDVLESRMNQFTSLKEGSTTGDAELQDIRVGADGKTYDTAGEAVRGQIGELKGDLVELTVDFQNAIGDSTTFTFTGEPSALSDLYLYANKTYVIENTSDYNGGSIYIEGHSSPNTYMRAKGVRFNFTPQFDGHLKWYNADIPSGTEVIIKIVGTIEDKVDKPLIYNVGSGKQYESFVQCIRALPTSKDIEKIVYVHGRTYDIYQDMGGYDFVASMSDSANWENVNPIIPPNTKIIGLGNVLFRYNCPDTIDPNKAVLLSCLNIRGSATIENINFECKNLRYAIHVEGSQLAEFDNSKYVVKNCKFRRLSGTYTNAVIGLGLNYGCQFRLEDCDVKSETTNGNSLLMHGNTTELNGSPKLIIKNCMLVDTLMSVQLLIRANSSAVIPVDIYNSYLKSTIYKTTSSSVQVDDEFAITLLNCNNVAIGNGSKVVNLKDTKRFGIVSTS